MGFKQIMLPTDGSEGVEHASNIAVTLAKQFDARIHVFHVVESIRLQDYGAFFALPEIHKEMEEAGVEILKKCATFIKESGYQNVITVQDEGYPADAILEYAQENKIDMIVLGTHGRRGFNRMVLGSVAEEVVRRAPMPVLTVRMAE